MKVGRNGPSKTLLVSSILLLAFTKSETPGKLSFFLSFLWEAFMEGFQLEPMMK